MLADLDQLDASRAVDAIYHLGDLVGYAPWPDEVVELLAARGIFGVAGNYDSTVAARYDHCGCRYEDPRQEELSRLSYAWTLEHVSAETRRRLAALPFRIDVRPLGGHASGLALFLVHGNPTLNTVYWTEERDDAFCRKMGDRLGARVGDVVAFGHTHRPWTRVVDGVRFLNAGSVGRPKDGDPRACYVTLTFAEGAGVAGSGAGGGAGATVDVSFTRVRYDVERAAAGIEHSGLPDELGAILRAGG